MDDILEIISYHHYIKNYPEDIDPKKAPPLAKVLAVADSIEAATAGRPYEKGKAWITVLKELRAPEGNYDQKVVDAFEKLVKEAL
jgi:HD-GYP domain-containing protein (c-di-GMP phosphodiesterase class II)